MKTIKSEYIEIELEPEEVKKYDLEKINKTRSPVPNVGLEYREEIQVIIIEIHSTQEVKTFSGAKTEMMNYNEAILGNVMKYLETLKK